VERGGVEVGGVMRREGGGGHGGGRGRGRDERVGGGWGGGEERGAEGVWGEVCRRGSGGERVRGDVVGSGKRRMKEGKSEVKEGA